MKYNKKIKIFSLLLITILFSLLLVGCNNNSSTEKNSQNEENKEIETISFSNEENNIKFNYPNDFKELEGQELIDNLNVGNISFEQDQVIFLSKSNEQLVILLYEDLTDNALENRKTSLDALSSYSDLNIKLEQNDFITLNNSSVLKSTMLTDGYKGTSFCFVTNNKLFVLQYMADADSFNQGIVNILENSITF